ncbi:MAG: iron-containing alcohol dehydrogenase [Blautia sp.]|nr:iron-containing alcohol dehydrogenase [Blautia sp.]
MKIGKSIYCRIYQLGFRIAMPLLPYREPEILTSIGTLAERLREMGKKHVLLITDAQLAKTGMADDLKQVLTEKEIQCTIFDKTVPNPTFDNIREASRMYLEQDCDTLIGFGGGSSMDCAKAVGASLAHPGKDIGQLVGIFKVHRRIPPLVTIPTTAGTGSEVTVAAVLTDSEKGIKSPMYDFAVIPSIAVHDWTLTRNLPKSLTATTGMDALTHAVEAYIGRSTSRYTRQKSEECVKLVHDYLYRAYTNGEDQEARQKMLLAAYDGGVALTQSYVGYIHALAHALGGLYGTPHGLANSVIMPYFLKLYGSSVRKQLAHLARITGEASYSDTDREACKKFIFWIEAMNRKMDIPTHLDGLDPKDFPFMAERADKEANPLYPVPVLLDRDILEQMYYVISGKQRLIEVVNMIRSQRK